MLSPDVAVAEAGLLVVATFFSGFSAQAIDRSNDRVMELARGGEAALRDELRYTTGRHEQHRVRTIPVVIERMEPQPLERAVRLANLIILMIMILLAIRGRARARRVGRQ